MNKRSPDWRRLARVPGIGLLLLLVMGAAVAVASQGGSSADYRVDFAKLQPRSTPLIVGAATHFGIGGEYGYDPVQTAQKIKELGLDSYREDLGWGVFSPTPGGPVAIPAKLANFMNQTDARPLLILHGSQPRVEGGQAPVTQAGRDAYAQFASEAVKAAAPYKPMFEMWNEWNLTAVRKPQFLVGEGDVSDPRAAANYAPLAAAGSAAIRRVSPNTLVLSGASGIDPGWAWTTSVVRHGGLSDASGLSVHLYNHCERLMSDRTARQAIDAAGALQAKLHQIRQVTTPLYITEFGWPTATQGGCVMDPQVSAANITQFMLWSAATPWVKGVWVYQLKDQGHNPADVEDNFGIYYYDYRPKPAACAVKAAMSIIHSARAWQISRPDPRLFVALASTSAGPRLIAWTTQAGEHARLTLPSGHAANAHMLCGGSAMSSDGHVEIGVMPVVLDATGLDQSDLRLDFE